MERALMYAGILTAIIVCFVGIVKSFCKGFKQKHPKGFKVVFSALSLILAVGLPILTELYVFNGQLYSEEFVMLLASTLGGVFGGYNVVYEGLGVKDLMKKLVINIGKLFSNAKESKLEKSAEKIVGKVGIEKLTAIAKKLEDEEKAKTATNENTTQTPTAPTTVKEIKF